MSTSGKSERRLSDSSQMTTMTTKTAKSEKRGSKESVFSTKSHLPVLDETDRMSVRSHQTSIKDDIDQRSVRSHQSNINDDFDQQSVRSHQSKINDDFDQQSVRSHQSKISIKDEVDTQSVKSHISESSGDPTIKKEKRDSAKSFYPLPEADLIGDRSDAVSVKSSRTVKSVKRDSDQESEIHPPTISGKSVKSERSEYGNESQKSDMKKSGDFDSINEESEGSEKSDDPEEEDEEYDGVFGSHETLSSQEEKADDDDMMSSVSKAACNILGFLAFLLGPEISEIIIDFIKYSHMLLGNDDDEKSSQKTKKTSYSSAKSSTPPSYKITSFDLPNRGEPPWSASDDMDEEETIYSDPKINGKAKSDGSRHTRRSSGKDMSEKARYPGPRSNGRDMSEKNRFPGSKSNNGKNVKAKRTKVSFTSQPDVYQSKGKGDSIYDGQR